LLGAAAGEGVERVVRSQSQGRRRSVDLATVWLHYDGGTVTFDAGSTGRGTGGGWGVDERIGAAEGDRQAAPKAEKQPFLGPAPPGIFSRWGHVTRPHNIIGWLFRLLCVTMAYGLRMSRLGASEECYIAHNVHLCPDLAKKPNVKSKIIFKRKESKSRSTECCMFVQFVRAATVLQSRRVLRLRVPSVLRQAPDPIKHQRHPLINPIIG